MDDFLLQPLASMPVHCEKYFCKTTFAGWRRTHKKSRIAKKWRKKYGATYKCFGHAVRFNGTLVVCPCVMKEIDKLEHRGVMKLLKHPPMQTITAM